MFTNNKLFSVFLKPKSASNICRHFGCSTSNFYGKSNNPLTCSVFKVINQSHTVEARNKLVISENTMSGFVVFNYIASSSFCLQACSSAFALSADIDCSLDVWSRDMAYYKYSSALLLELSSLRFDGKLQTFC